MRKAQQAEHFFLQVASVNADRARTHFNAIEHQVVDLARTEDR